MHRDVENPRSWNIEAISADGGVAGFVMVFQDKPVPRQNRIAIRERTGGIQEGQGWADMIRVSPDGHGLGLGLRCSRHCENEVVIPDRTFQLGRVHGIEGDSVTDIFSDPLGFRKWLRHSQKKFKPLTVHGRVGVLPISRKTKRLRRIGESEN
jgi:hypothetical protein